jgi:hypothetical protein
MPPPLGQSLQATVTLHHKYVFPADSSASWPLQRDYKLPAKLRVPPQLPQCPHELTEGPRASA